MNRIVHVTLIAILATVTMADVGAQSPRAAAAESWIRWPWHFPCLRIFGCYPPELPPLTPPDQNCGWRRPC